MRSVLRGIGFAWVVVVLAVGGSACGPASDAQSRKVLQKIEAGETPTVEELDDLASAAAETDIIPVASGPDVLFRGDFESGDLSQWANKEMMSADRFAVIQSPLKQGRYAARVTVRPGDDPINASGERNEVVIGSKYYEYEGMEQWYRWQLMLPSGFPINQTNGWLIFLQWHQDWRGSGGSPPLSFQVEGGYIWMSFHRDSTEFKRIRVAPAKLDQWMDFVFHAKWSSSNSTGFVQVFLNGSEVVPKTYVATMYPNLYNYLKFGLYRNEMSSTTTLYLDGMTIGKTQAAVMSGSATPAPSPIPTGSPGYLQIMGVAASTNTPAESPASMAVDGNLSTYWACSGTDGSCYLRADLGSLQSVGAVDLAWYLSSQRTEKFAIQLSGDGANYTTVFSGSSSQSYPDFQRFSFATRQARYVKIVGYGNSVSAWNSLRELKVLLSATAPAPSPSPISSYTPPAPAPSPTPTGTLGFVSITGVSASSNTMADGPASKAVDGDMNTYWACSGTDGSCYLRADLGSLKYVGAVDLAWYQSTARTEKFAIQLSGDGSSYTTVFSGSSSTSYSGYQRFSFAARQARYVKIVGYGNSVSAWNSLREIKVLALGDSTTSPAPSSSPVPVSTGIIPVASGPDVIFRGDFETGNLSQWGSREIMSGTTDRFTIVQNPVKQGRYAARITVKPGDDPIGASGERSEVHVSQTYWESEGMERWYRWQTMFPTGFPVNNTSGWQIFLQWHQDADFGGSPPVEFKVEGGYIWLSFHEGGTEFKRIRVGAAKLDQWHDFVFHAKWSANGSVGFVHVFLDGVEVVPKTYVRTMYPGLRNYLKQGFYRAESSQTTTLYHDGMTIGRTQASVMGQ